MKTIETIIRRGGLSDREKIFPLVKDFATSFKPEKKAFDFSFDQIINDESACLLVAEIDTHVIGYCLGFDHFAFYANGRISWVEEIMVREDFRKKNIGRALMDQFEEWSRSRNSNLVGLATRRAAPFYKALDYENSAVFFRKILYEKDWSYFDA
jgi:GNAT superfamily N-acetyltransferase